ncbi:unnamed protein product [Echinostoma caproni]|uniref:WD_REPEATS_REGION domain-containing protein n=1 Tax=Echinostoma caproni TaxID=27848 RepID=A0A183AV00_9TREM|nr:unnamed protein product [Echinostoma caproni]
MKNGSVYVYFGDSGRLVTVIEGHEGAIHAVTPSPLNEEIVATAGVDGRFQIWHIERYRDYTAQQEATSNGFGFGSGLGLTDSADPGAPPDPSPLLYYYRYPPGRFHLAAGVVWLPPDSGTTDQPICGVPFHRLPPPYLTNFVGAPLPAEAQLRVPGRTCLENPMDLVPTLTIDEDGVDIVLDDIQFCTGVPPEYCPPIRPPTVRPIPSKTYLWQSLWLGGRHSLIEPLTETEMAVYQEQSHKLYRDEVEFYVSKGEATVTFGEVGKSSNRTGGADPLSQNRATTGAGLTDGESTICPPQSSVADVSHVEITNSGDQPSTRVVDELDDAEEEDPDEASEESEW